MNIETTTKYVLVTLIGAFASVMTTKDHSDTTPAAASRPAHATHATD